MSLIQCVDCGHKVSTMAESCPNCGCPVSVSINAAKMSENLIDLDLVQKMMTEKDDFSDLDIEEIGEKDTDGTAGEDDVNVGDGPVRRSHRTEGSDGEDDGYESFWDKLPWSPAQSDRILKIALIVVGALTVIAFIVTGIMFSQSLKTDGGEVESESETESVSESSSEGSSEDSEGGNSGEASNVNDSDAAGADNSVSSDTGSTGSDNSGSSDAGSTTVQPTAGADTNANDTVTTAAATAASGNAEGYEETTAEEVTDAETSGEETAKETTAEAETTDETTEADDTAADSDKSTTTAADSDKTTTTAAETETTTAAEETSPAA